MKTNSGPYYALPMGHEHAALVKRGKKIIAEVFADREEGDQYQTAALFAAAPALLEALHTLRNMGLGPEAFRICSAAIAQALEGQQ
jgi:hypothetical protein